MQRLLWPMSADPEKLRIKEVKLFCSLFFPLRLRDQSTVSCFPSFGQYGVTSEKILVSVGFLLFVMSRVLNT
jgi:hypothetical protein